MGCTVEGSHPHDKVDDINDGTMSIPVSYNCFVYLSCFIHDNLYFSAGRVTYHVLIEQCIGLILCDLTGLELKLL